MPIACFILLASVAKHAGCMPYFEQNISNLGYEKLTIHYNSNKEHFPTIQNPLFLFAFFFFFFDNGKVVSKTKMYKFTPLISIAG